MPSLFISTKTLKNPSQEPLPCFVFFFINPNLSRTLGKSYLSLSRKRETKLSFTSYLSVGVSKVLPEKILVRYVHPMQGVQNDSSQKNGCRSIHTACNGMHLQSSYFGGRISERWGFNTSWE